jgi:hypothetical protein
LRAWALDVSRASDPYQHAVADLDGAGSRASSSALRNPAARRVLGRPPIVCLEMPTSQGVDFVHQELQESVFYPSSDDATTQQEIGQNKAFGVLRRALERRKAHDSLIAKLVARAENEETSTFTVIHRANIGNSKATRGQIELIRLLTHLRNALEVRLSYGRDMGFDIQ